MKIIIGSDHAGFRLKEEIKKMLLRKYQVEDVGAYSEEPSDYPLYAKKVAKKTVSSGSKGIMVCKTGIGSCMAVNKVKGARGALPYSEKSARLSREHNNANVICLGSIMDKKLAKKMVNIFLKTKFSEGARHKRRIKELDRI